MASLYVLFIYYDIDSTPKNEVTSQNNVCNLIA
jgi:hypothetical protein